MLSHTYNDLMQTRHCSVHYDNRIQHFTLGVTQTSKLYLGALYIQLLRVLSSGPGGMPRHMSFTLFSRCLNLSATASMSVVWELLEWCWILWVVERVRVVWLDEWSIFLRLEVSGEVLDVRKMSAILLPVTLHCRPSTWLCRIKSKSATSWDDFWCVWVKVLSRATGVM